MAGARTSLLHPWLNNEDNYIAEITVDFMIFLNDCRAMELPLLAEGVEEVGADTFCATIVPVG